MNDTDVELCPESLFTRMRRWWRHERRRRWAICVRTSHRAFGWCGMCPGRNVLEELAEWQFRAARQQCRENLAARGVVCPDEDPR